MDHAAAKELLFTVADALEARGILFFLHCGTALGAYREGDFIAHDGDIDLAVRFEDAAPHFKPLAAKLGRHGYEVKICRRPFSFPRALKVRSVGSRMDIAGYFLEGDTRFCLSSCKDYAIVLPARYFEPIEQIKMLGRQFYIHHPAAEYLELNYGPEYMTPIRGDNESRQRVYGFRPEAPPSFPRRARRLVSARRRKSRARR